MALNIRNDETEKLAADLAALTGETKTESVTKALKDRLEQVKRRRSKRRLADRLDEIAKHCASLPLLDRRSPEDMLYNEQGARQMIIDTRLFVMPHQSERIAAGYSRGRFQKDRCPNGTALANAKRSQRVRRDALLT